MKVRDALRGVVWKEGKHFVSQCLNVDVASFGSSKAEAITNLQEALDLRFEDNSHAAIQTVGDPELVVLHG